MKRLVIALISLPLLGGCSLTAQDIGAALYYGAAYENCNRDNDSRCRAEVDRYRDAYEEERRRERREQDDAP